MKQAKNIFFSLCLALTVGSGAMAQSEFSPVEVDHQYALLSPNLYGSTGLYRIFSGEQGPDGNDSISFGFYGYYFNQKDFPTQGIETERAEGKLLLSYTPLPWLEAFAGVGAVTSNNKTPAFPLVRQVGNLDLGFKFSRPLGSSFMRAGFVTMLDVDQVVKTITGSSTALSAQGVAVFTMNFLEKGLPFRLHANAGYRKDQTGGIVNSTSDERTRVITKSLPDDVLLVGLGAEYVRNALAVNLEYTLDRVMGQSGKTFLDHPQRVTLGATYFPASNRSLAIKLGSDVGFFATRSANRVLREPTYGIHIGVMYQLGMAKYNAGGSSPVTSFDVQPKNTVVAPVRQDGRIFGLVTELNSGQAVADAKLFLCDDQESPIVTDRFGNYRSYPLPVGACTLRIQKEGYAEVVETIQVLQGESKQDFSMVSQERRKGSLLIQITDEAGQPLQGEITFPEHEDQIKDIQTNEMGQIRIKINAGSYALRTRVPGMKFQTKRIDVVEGEETQVDFVLEPEMVRIAQDQKSIEINSQIQFQSGKAVLTEAGKRILDDVAVLMLENPQIKKVEIAGHTDNTGDANVNLDLSQRRAESVKLYLVSKGIDAGKMEALGYGQDFPIASNQTEEGRTQNRRVEFKIVAQD
ncbi:MAG: OmpA family protein [Bdellovibrionota bacterium]